MNIPAHLDPFHLVSLSEDIDQQCQRLVGREFPKVVDDKALHTLKIKLRENLTSLLTEMLNEWQHLATEVGDDSVFDQNWVIPTVPDMAIQLPQIYGPAPGGDAKSWHIERVRWTINSWLQMWGQLFAYLPKAGEEEAPEDVSIPAVELSLVRMAKPNHIYAVLRIWQMIRLLTLEYLEAKAQLLSFLGKNDIEIEVKDDLQDILTQATEAFWHKRADASLLLILAVRQELVQQLNIMSQLRTLPLRLPTSALVAIAADAGLPFPHSVEIIGNIVFDLEGQQNLGEPLKMAYLYPVFRILSRTIEEWRKSTPTEAVQHRAAVILEQIAQQYSPHANHPQS